MRLRPPAFTRKRNKQAEAGEGWSLARSEAAAEPGGAEFQGSGWAAVKASEALRSCALLATRGWPSRVRAPAPASALPRGGGD